MGAKRNAQGVKKINRRFTQIKNSKAHGAKRGEQRVGSWQYAVKTVISGRQKMIRKNSWRLILDPQPFLADG